MIVGFPGAIGGAQNLFNGFPYQKSYISGLDKDLVTSRETSSLLICDNATWWKHMLLNMVLIEHWVANHFMVPFRAIQ